MKNSILSKIYGFTTDKVLMAHNGSWEMEQCRDNGLVYTARLLDDGDIFITVETQDRFKKLVCEYKIN